MWYPIHACHLHLNGWYISAAICSDAISFIWGNVLLWEHISSVLRNYRDTKTVLNTLIRSITVVFILIWLNNIKTPLSWLSIAIFHTGRTTKDWNEKAGFNIVFDKKKYCLSCKKPIRHQFITWANTDLSVNWPIGTNKHQWNVNQNRPIFFEENALEKYAYNAVGIWFMHSYLEMKCAELNSPPSCLSLFKRAWLRRYHWYRCLTFGWDIHTKHCDHTSKIVG